MRGRKPLPSHLKLITGNRGKRPIKKPSVEFEISQPAPPPHLCDDAKVEWGRVASMLYALRLLSALDVAALAAYCQAYAIWKQATEALNVMAKSDDTGMLGLVARGANGARIAHPLLKIANRAAQDMVRYASDFGMTPAARARIHAGEMQAPQDPAEKYFT